MEPVDPMEVAASFVRAIDTAAEFEAGLRRVQRAVAMSRRELGQLASPLAQHAAATTGGGEEGCCGR